MTRTLPRQPQLRRDALVLFPRGEELSVVLSPRKVLTVRPANLELAEWLQLLDGTAPLEKAVAAAPIDPDQTERLLGELAAAGFLTDANDGLFFRHPAVEAADAVRLARQTRRGGRWELPRASVAVAGPGRWAQRLRTALRLPGVLVQPLGAPCDLLVLLREALDPGLADSSAAALASGTPHLVVVVSGQDASLLPLTLPGRTACSRCWLLHRDLRGMDWPAWGLRGRDPEPPRLAAHRSAMVLSLVVEHVLGVLPAIADPDDPAALAEASVERYLDFGRGCVEVRRCDPHPACGCLGVAA